MEISIHQEYIKYIVVYKYFDPHFIFFHIYVFMHVCFLKTAENSALPSQE